VRDVIPIDVEVGESDDR